MSDNADGFRQFFGLTRKCCTLLSGWVYGSVSAHFRDLFRKDSVLMDPIDISSDSDIDFDFSDEEFQLSPEREPTNTRILPAWANSSHASSSRNAVVGPNISSAGWGYTSNGHGNLIHANDNSSKKLQNKPGSSRSFRAANSPNSQADNVRRFLGDGTFGHSRKVNPQIANVSGAEYEKLSTQQASKRTLPPSFKSAAFGHRFENIADVASSSQSRNGYGSMHHTLGSSSSNSRGLRDPHDPSNDDLVIMNGKTGSRILPPSFLPGVTDEKASESDERLIYQAALQDLYQPKTEADIPHGLLSVSLLKHQKIALQWMLQRETRSLHCLGGILADDQGLGKTISMIALIQMQRSLESSSKSEDNCNKKAEALNLDEDDENDINNLDNSKQVGESAVANPQPEVESSTRSFRGRRPPAGTLVVCPASVLRQWDRELDEKVAHESKLRVLIYHGGSRTKDPFELATYDVVLTTYAIVTNEVPKQPLVDEEDGQGNNVDAELSSEFSHFKKQKKTNISKKRKKGKKGVDNYGIDCNSGALARVAWLRVILDEAQTIKNHRTQIARACCSLRAKRRWCLSGTPIQNTIDDLYSYFRFLRYEPYNVYKSFINAIKVPISRHPLNGYKKLQVVLRGILLRRTKGTLINGEPIINLPPKSVCLKKVEFSSKERAFYSWLEADSRSKFKAFAAAGTVKQNYANILLMLLRLRQACDHPVLVKSSVSNSSGKLSAEMAEKLPRDMVINLLNHLAASSAICLICNDPPEDPIVTMCGHVFCYQCVSEYLTGDENACPARDCKEPLGSDVVFSADTLRSCASYNGDTDFTSREFDEELVVWNREYCSSKIRAVIDILQSHNDASSSTAEFDDHVGGSRTSREKTTSGAIKSIIFSQWTGMLDLVEDSLRTGLFNYRRLDGTMSLAARDKAVKDFNKDPEVTVMLMSLKAGNLGLNMVAASHVIMLDLWWNPTTEDQAVDRAHRIGQTRPVTVTRLTINGTVEDRILALQEEKRKMVSSAFGEDQTGASNTRLTQEDLRYLFKV